MSQQWVEAGRLGIEHDFAHVLLRNRRAGSQR
jgi:hypothetical protein